MTKAQEKEIAKQEAIATLRKMGVKPGATIYTNVTHVARSGMSRRIRCYIITKDTSTDRNGKRKTEPGMHDITGLVATACGFARHNGWDIKIGGCGMDMCFQVVYLLGRAMFPDGGPLSVSPRQWQEERDGQTKERNGGYLLTKRDL